MKTSAIRIGLSTWLALGALLFGCEARTFPAEYDAGPRADGARLDGAAADGARADLGLADAGTDGGPRDSGALDAELADLGESLDAATDAGADAGAPTDAGPLTTSQQLAAARAAADGATSVPIAGALVTYVRPVVSGAATVGGFFVQADRDGPALFVEVDPAALTPALAIGDRVSFTVTAMASESQLRKATSIIGFTREATGLTAEVAALVRDQSAATDLVTALDTLESELQTATGTLGATGSGGTGYARFEYATAGLATGVRLRVPQTLVSEAGLQAGCAATITATPLWRNNTIPQVAAWRRADFTALTCPAPTVVSARSTGSTSAVVVLSRPLDPASITAGAFTVDNGLTVSAAVAGAMPTEVVLTTSAQTPATVYTVTVAATVRDVLSVAVGTPNTATFTGMSAPLATPTTGGQLVITEIMYHSTGTLDREWAELYNPGTAALELSGCTISDNNTTSTTWKPIGSGSLVAPAGGYITISWVASPGFAATYAFTSNAPNGLNNAGDSVVLRCGAGNTEIDRVDYDDRAPFPVDMAGYAIQLSPTSLTAAANDAGANWCRATAIYDGTDRGSPNAANGSCTPPGPVVTSAAPTMPAIGSPVVLAGVRFTGASAVTIGGVTQTFTVVSDTQVRVDTLAAGTPVGAGQPVIVSVGAQASAPITVDVLPRLAVVSAAATSATTVTVTFNRAVDAATVAPGDFLVAGLTVSAASTAGAVVTLTTSTQTPAMAYLVVASGISDVPGNALTGAPMAAFTGFGVPAPALTSVAPTDVVRGVSQLTITGTNLDGTSAVTIGGAAQATTTVTATQVVVGAVAVGTPLGAQSVVVTTPGGMSNASTVNVLERLRVVMAVATSATELRVTFNRDPAAASVAAGDFVIPGLTVSAVSVTGATATLTTSAQAPAMAYTVTASGIDDPQGVSLDPAFSTAMFSGFGVPVPVLASVMPAQVVRGVSQLTIDGAQLAGATVTIGGVAQTTTTVTATQVVVGTVAVGTPTGTQPVVITTPGGPSNTLTVDVLDRLRVASAAATGPTTVVVTLSRAPNGATVAAGDFAIPGLTVSAAVVSGATVMLTTSAQSPLRAYVVTVSGVDDPQGASVDPANATASFEGYAELVIVRVGDGLAAVTNAATPVFLERVRADGMSAGAAVALPTTTVGAQRRFSMSGTATSEGALSRSPDGRFLALGGYDAAIGTASIASTSAATAPRIAAVISAGSGTLALDTRTTFGGTFGGNNMRGATSDGVGVWGVAQGGGVQYTLLGPPPAGDPSMQPMVAISSTFANLRTIQIAGGQLYVTGAAGTLFGVATVGAGIPTTAGQTTTVLPGWPTAAPPSPNAAVLLDLNAGVAGVDTAYVCDDRAVASGGGILRWTLVGASWVNGGVVSAVQCRGLTATVVGADVILFATDTATPAKLVRVTDVGASSTGQTPTTVLTAATNTVFRGVAFAPVP